MSGVSLVQRVGAAVKVGGALIKGKPLEFGDAGIIGSLLPTDYGDPPKRGTKELLEAYSTMPWLRAVTSKVAMAVGSTQWRLYGTKRANAQRFHRDYKAQRTGNWTERRKHLIMLKQQGELVEVEAHPALDLLHNANPYHVGVAARRVLQVYLDLTGEFFQLLERGPMGVPVAYWPLPSTWVKEIPTPSHPYYKVKLGNEEFDIPATEIIWAADLDPNNPYGRGTSLAGTLGDELETQEYAAKHVKATFFNRARPDFLAWVKPRSGEDAVSVSEMRRLQQRWLQQHQGFFRALKPHFVNRELAIHEFEQDFRKQSLIPIMEYERDTIIQVFGFPPEVFGVLESSNRATIDAADYLFAKYATDPRLEFLREVWQERLIPYYDDRLILDYDSPIEKDKEHILNVAKAAPWAFSGDEWRGMAEYESLEEDEGKVFGVPANIILEESLQDAAGMLEPIDSDDGAKQLTKGIEVDKLSDPAYVFFHRLADRLEPRLRNAFIEAVGRMKSATTRSALEAAIRAGNPPAEIVDMLPWDVLQESLGPKATNILRQGFARSIEFSAERLSSTLGGVEVGYTIEHPAAVRWLNSHMKQFLRGVQNVNREAILNHVRAAYEEGMAPAELAKKIERHIGLTDKQIRGVENFEDRLRNQGVKPEQIERRVERVAQAHVRNRAKMIGRTETIRSANQGQQMVWEQAAEDGLVRESKVRRKWLVTPDDRLCELCEPMDDQTVKLDEDFTRGDGESVISPPAHPNCRCTVVMEV